VFAAAEFGAEVSIGWFDNPRNKSWQRGGDGRDPTRRMPVVAAMVERFGAWHDDERRIA
jgi:hypothetical protein